MDILSLSGNNFLSLKDFYIELDGRGLLLIQGENKSDTSADSNGAGKSSIPDSLSWACYGITARGLTGDAIVNNTAKKDTDVKVVLKDGGTRYRIERYRKHSVHKNQVFVFQIDPSGAEVDLSKGTDKETQIVINGILGATADVFNAAIYAGQEKMPDLPGMTDKNLKVLLEESAGTEELTECYAVARADSLAGVKQMDLLQQSFRDMISQLESFRATVIQTQEVADQFEATRRDRALDILKDVPAQSALIDTLNAELAALDEAGTKALAIDTQAKIRAVEGEKVELSNLNSAFNAISREFSAASVVEKNAGQAYLKAKAALEAVDHQVGQPCSECGKAYCVEDLEAVRTKRQAELEAAKNVARDTAAETVDIAGRMQEAEEAVALFKSKMTDVSVESQALDDLTNKLRDIQAKNNQVKAGQERIDRMKSDAGIKLKEDNPHVPHVRAAESRVLDAEAALVAKQGEIDALAGEVQILEDIVKVFSPAGVRAHILDSITPFLNDRTRDYLGALSDGNSHAVWSTLTKTAKGELKEKFNIEVTNDLGGDTFAALSGGEKRKVRLATAMALQEMVASRATKPINLFIADEIDHALDESGLERLMGILDKRAKAQGTVLVISHNALADWVPDVITVEKNGKVSTLSGATHKTF